LAKLLQQYWLTKSLKPETSRPAPRPSLKILRPPSP
jgi:hypothetical protein